jgi:serine/threonine protein kinase
VSPRELVPGSIVGGKYAVRSVLGKTPVAVTYHAFTAPNREVALKLYDPALARRPDVIAELGAAAAAARDLPGHLALEEMDDGVDAELGAPFRVTELSPLPPLSQLVSLCALTPDEALAMIRSLAAALDLVHARGLAHLDLKPNNVFVGPPPRYAVRLGDFGAGFSTATERSPAQLAWAAPWLAPEQIDGPGAPQSDVMACALVAFHAMTGKSYWRSCSGEIDLAAWRDELRAPRASASARAHELRVVIPPRLDAAFARALAPDPGDRFASVGDFLAALEGRPPAETAPKPVAIAASPIEPAIEPPAVSTPDPFPSGSIALDVPAPAAAPPPVASESPPRPAGRKRVSPVLVLAPLGGLALIVGVAIALRGSKPEPAAAPSSAPLPAPTPTREPATTADPPPASAAPAPTATTMTTTTAPSAPPPPAVLPPSPDGSGLEITCMPACVSVKIDGVEVPIEPSTPLPAGHHTILVTSVNGVKKLLSINLKPGRVEKMFFQLGKPKK